MKNALCSPAGPRVIRTAGPPAPLQPSSSPGDTRGLYHRVVVLPKALQLLITSCLPFPVAAPLPLILSGYLRTQIMLLLVSEHC